MVGDVREELTVSLIPGNIKNIFHQIFDLLVPPAGTLTELDVSSAEGVNQVVL